MDNKHIDLVEIVNETWKENELSDGTYKIATLEALQKLQKIYEKPNNCNMKLYHVTTPRKAKKYRQTGVINSPVRGFTTLQGAMAWALKVSRTVIYEIDCDNAHKLPDHHNTWGEAWWNDGDVASFKCVFSSDSNKY